MIVRNVQSVRDLGFLPGTLDEKVKPLENPYHHMFYELFGFKDSFEMFRRRGTVEFQTTSYIRGITLNNTIVLVDECQNLNFHECDSLATRIGNNSKIIFCGDKNQTDLVGKEKNGILGFMDILKSMASFKCVEFGLEDIVRSGFVKEYLVAKEKLFKKIK
jgi:phosphate starvation-inducible protein PhoH